MNSPDSRLWGKPFVLSELEACIFLKGGTFGLSLKWFCHHLDYNLNEFFLWIVFQSLQEKQFHMFILNGQFNFCFFPPSYSLPTMKHQHLLRDKQTPIIWMKSSLKTCQLGMCNCTCKMSYIQLQMQRAVPAINDSDIIMGQANDWVGQDSVSSDSFGADSSFTHQHRHNHSLNVLEGAGMTFYFWHKQVGIENTHRCVWEVSSSSLGLKCQLIKRWLLSGGDAKWGTLSKVEYIPFAPESP